MRGTLTFNSVHIYIYIDRKTYKFNTHEGNPNIYYYNSVQGTENVVFVQQVDRACICPLQNAKVDSMHA